MNGAAPEPEKLLALAVEMARLGANTARRMRADAIVKISTKSSATDVVTAADRAVERQVVAALRAARPRDTVLGEEYGAAAAPPVGGPSSTPAPERSSVRWILDPIDGTVNYLYGLPLYAVSLAAEVDGAVVAAVVHNAATGDEWTATRGGGAYRDGRRLHGSTVNELSQALLGTGFGYDAGRRAHQAAVLAGVLPRVRDIRRFGSAAIDLCMAAEGALDGFYEKGLNAWDHAAGALVATEAGLMVGGLGGAPPGLDLVIAAPPALFPALHDLLAEHDAAGGP